MVRQMSDPISEGTIRNRARRHGYALKKSRRKRPTQWDRCGYTLTHAETNIIVVGPYVDASLADVAEFLSRLGGTNA